MWVMKVLLGIGAASLLAAMLVFVSNIIFRAFGKPIPGTYEMIGVCMVPVIAFAIGYTALVGGHVAIDIVIKRLQKRSQTICAFITTLLSIAFWALVAWKSTEFGLRQWTIGETTLQLLLPMSLFRMIWAFGLWVLVFALCVELARVAKGQKNR